MNNWLEWFQNQTKLKLRPQNQNQTRPDCSNTTLEYYELEIEDVIFRQDNDPKHISGKAKKWFQGHNLNVLKWPAQSPDLNPIKHLWNYLKKMLKEYDEPVRGVEELWTRVQEQWDRIPKEKCQKLIESMLYKVKAVYKANGSYTKY